MYCRQTSIVKTTPNSCSTLLADIEPFPQYLGNAVSLWFFICYSYRPPRNSMLPYPSYPIRLLLFIIRTALLTILCYCHTPRTLLLQYPRNSVAVLLIPSYCRTPFNCCYSCRPPPLGECSRVLVPDLHPFDFCLTKSFLLWCHSFSLLGNSGLFWCYSCVMVPLLMSWHYCHCYGTIAVLPPGQFRVAVFAPFCWRSLIPSFLSPTFCRPLIDDALVSMPHSYHPRMMTIQERWRWEGYIVWEGWWGIMAWPRRDG